MGELDGASGGSGGGSFNGEITRWPEDQALTICNVPIDEKTYIRYVATEWFKNQTIVNPRQQAIEAIKNAKMLYQQLASEGYMDA